MKIKFFLNILFCLMLISISAVYFSPLAHADAGGGLMLPINSPYVIAGDPYYSSPYGGNFIPYSPYTWTDGITYDHYAYVDWLRNITFAQFPWVATGASVYKTNPPAQCAIISDNDFAGGTGLNKSFYGWGSSWGYPCHWMDYMTTELYWEQCPLSLSGCIIPNDSHFWYATNLFTNHINTTGSYNTATGVWWYNGPVFVAAGFGEGSNNPSWQAGSRWNITLNGVNNGGPTCDLGCHNYFSTYFGGPDPEVPYVRAVQGFTQPGLYQVQLLGELSAGTSGTGFGSTETPDSTPVLTFGIGNSYPNAWITDQSGVYNPNGVKYNISQTMYIYGSDSFGIQDLVYNLYQQDPATGAWNNIDAGTTTTNGYPIPVTSPGNYILYDTATNIEGNSSTITASFTIVNPIPVWNPNSLSINGQACPTGTSSNQSVTLQWNAASNVYPSTNPTTDFYRVFRSTDGGVTFTQISGNLATTTYTDTTVARSTQYVYEVEAFNQYDTSGVASNQASVTTQSCASMYISTIIPNCIDSNQSITINSTGGTMQSVTVTLKDTASSATKTFTWKGDSHFTGSNPWNFTLNTTDMSIDTPPGYTNYSLSVSAVDTAGTPVPGQTDTFTYEAVCAPANIRTHTGDVHSNQNINIQ